MDSLSVITWIISLVVAVLQIILFVKIWIMANAVINIRDMMIAGRQTGTPGNYPISQTPNKVSRSISPENLEKGKRYDLGTLGMCTYEGMFQHKYGFYPVTPGSVLKSSPYLCDGSEPYYLVPAERLNEFGISEIQ